MRSMMKQGHLKDIAQKKNLPFTLRPYAFHDGQSCPLKKIYQSLYAIMRSMVRRSRVQDTAP